MVLDIGCEGARLHGKHTAQTVLEVRMLYGSDAGATLLLVCCSEGLLACTGLHLLPRKHTTALQRPLAIANT